MSTWTYIEVHCDSEECERQSDPYVKESGWTYQIIRRRLRSAGWVHTKDGRDYCPEHRDEAKETRWSEREILHELLAAAAWLRRTDWFADALGRKEQAAINLWDVSVGIEETLEGHRAPREQGGLSVERLAEAIHAAHFHGRHMTMTDAEADNWLAERILAALQATTGEQAND